MPAEVTFLIQRHSNKIPPNPKDRNQDNKQLYIINGEIRFITEGEFTIFKEQQKAKIEKRDIVAETEIIEYMPGLTKRGVEAAFRRGGEIALEVIQGKYDIVIFAGETSLVRTRSTNQANLKGLEEKLTTENTGFNTINIADIFNTDVGKSFFVTLRNNIKKIRMEINEALSEGLIPIVNVPLKFFGEKELLEFGGGEGNLKEIGYLNYLNQPINEGDIVSEGEETYTYNYLQTKGKFKSEEFVLPHPKVLALQQKYNEYRIRKVLKLLIPESKKILVINTSHGVLTDVTQAASVKETHQRNINEQIETVINQGEGVLVGPNSEISYRQAQDLLPATPVEILDLAVPDFIQEDLRKYVTTNQNEFLSTKAIIDYFVQMEIVNQNLSSKIFTLAKSKIKSWHKKLDLDQFNLNKFEDVRNRSQEKNPSNFSETLWWLEQEFGKALREIIRNFMS